MRGQEETNLQNKRCQDFPKQRRTRMNISKKVRKALSTNMEIFNRAITSFVDVKEIIGGAGMISAL